MPISGFSECDWLFSPLPVSCKENRMSKPPESAISAVFSYLVHPGKNEPKQEKIRGTTVSSGTKLYNVICELFVKTDAECNLEVVFKPDAAGLQNNPCQQLILGFKN